MTQNIKINWCGTIGFGIKEPEPFGKFIRHRDGDLPALIFTDGSVWYMQKDVKHRDGDNPAVIETGGIKEWYKYGERYYPNVSDNKTEGSP